MHIKKITILVIFYLFCSSGNSQENNKYNLFERSNYHFPYELSKPDSSWKLPKKLVEISGLSYMDKNRLACIQDEKGNIYIFNLTTGKVERKIDFGDDGDYEGIEIINKDAWILKSNGTLFKVTNFLNDQDLIVKKHSTLLSKKNDAEGLTFDPINKNLLIACKGHPHIDKKAGKEFKAIYSYDYNTNVLDLDPFLLIEIDSIKKFKNYNTMATLGVELLAFFDSSKGDMSFQPSGIAIHPITGNIYILGSVGNLLIVFSRDGTMLAMVKLRSRYFPQAEGICFSPDGTLYIANEGDVDKGTVLKFETKY